MRILTETQDTIEWEMARKARITASNINAVLAGDGTITRQKYALQLVLDLEGVPDFGDTSPWFVAGKQYESYARGWYQWEYNTEVKPVGFVLHDEYNWFGCSPDGLLPDNGNLEIKYRKTLETFHKVTSHKIPRAYLYQMQAQMFITGTDWTAYVNYWRSEQNQLEKGVRIIVERDAALCRELESAAMRFWGNEVLPLWQARNGNAPIEYPWDRWQAKREELKRKRDAAMQSAG